MTRRPWNARVFSQSTVTPLHKFLTGATNTKGHGKIQANLYLLLAMPLAINLNPEILIFTKSLVLVSEQYKPWSLLSSTSPPPNQSLRCCKYHLMIVLQNSETRETWTPSKREHLTLIGYKVNIQKSTVFLNKIRKLNFKNTPCNSIKKYETFQHKLKNMGKTASQKTNNNKNYEKLKT